VDKIKTIKPNSVKQRGKMARESGKTTSKTFHPDMCHDPAFPGEIVGVIYGFYCKWLYV
jgi:hypothetical protein